MDAKVLKDKVQILEAELDGTILELSHEECSASRLKIKSLRLDKISVAFDETEGKLIEINAALPKSKRNLTDINDMHVRFYEKLEQAQGLIFDRTETSSANYGQSKSAVSATAAACQLKPLDLPILIGSNNFATWFEIFNNLVDKSGMSDVLKYNYMINSINKDNQALISAFLPISASNYQLAKNCLISHYDNKRLQVSEHLNRMLSYEVLKTNRSSDELADFVKVFSQSVNTLQNMNIQNLVQVILFQTAYSKLDSATRRHFDSKQSDLKELCTIEQLMEFLTDRVKVADLEKSVKTSGNGALQPEPIHKRHRPQALVAKVETSAQSYKAVPCVLCSPATHPLYKCFKFQRMDMDGRQRIVKEHKLCSSCLSKGSHSSKDCPSTYKCKNCQARHHTLLCNKASMTATVKQSEATNKQFTYNSNSSANTKHIETGINPNDAQSLTCMSGKPITLLSTAIVHTIDAFGKPVALRCVIDSGSHLNFLTERAVQALGLKRFSDSTQIRGIGGPTTQAKGRVELSLRSPFNWRFYMQVSALVLPRICGKLPSREVPDSLYRQLSAYSLSDHSFNVPADVDALFGAQFYSDIISSDKPVVKCEGVTLQYTELGYIVLGSISSPENSNIALLSIDEELTEAVARMWQLDAEPPAPKAWSPLEVQAEEFFVKSTSRLANGAYQVRYPFKTDTVTLARNKFSPVKAYLSLEKRLLRNPLVATQYNKFFLDYLSDSMMELAKSTAHYLLVHHWVIKQSSSTTKVRPVFNGSALDINNNSLNGQLLSGPSLQADIFDVLFAFRFSKIPLCCDVKRMYNQIWIHPDDRKLQHIIWRPDASHEVREYELTRLTFGLAPSAWLAQRTVQQLVNDEGSQFPLAAHALRHQIYVDNIAVSYDSLSVAMEAKSQLIELFRRGGFELRQFASSVPELLADLPEEHVESINFDDPQAVLKILGLAWNVGTDSFRYNILEFALPYTKRGVLSYVARVYDFKGLLAPITLTMKIFLKQLWALGVEWDTPVDESFKKEWSAFVTELPLLKNLRIPRFIPCFTCDELQLWGFSDGSAVGYAAALYLRCVYTKHADVFLIRGKSKTTPTKPQLTIPKIELTAASMMADLYSRMLPTLKKLSINKTYFCVDSSICLAWLRMGPKLKTYCSNRVNNILTKTEVESWKYIPGDINCADIATRPILPSKMISYEDIWFKGPSFIRQVPIIWPDQLGLTLSQAELPELKNDPLKHVLLTVDNVPCFDVYFVQRFSSLTKMVRIYALILRYQHNLLCKLRNMQPRYGVLSLMELKSSIDTVVRRVQKDNYEFIFEGKEVPKQLRSLTPTVQNNFVVVGGRLKNAPLPSAARNPKLIPKNTHLAVLICRDAHFKTLHGGPLLMKSVIQAQYWIVGIQRILRRCSIECTRCYRFSGKTADPMMADIPAIRFTHVRAFLCSSADFCGPFMVHEGTRPRARIVKVYVCVFTCLSVRATHLEVVQDLTCESFLSAVDRLSSRRGYISKLFVDNATNFTSGARKLSEDVQFFREHGSEIEKLLIQRQTEFVFNTVATPHRNGVTERMVGLFKRHLVRVVGNSTLTFTEFQTLVTRIEGILNSRPLIPLSVDASDAILTPAHFLTGDSLFAVTEPSLQHLKLNSLSRWQVVTSTLQSFWKIWQNFYLQTLMARCKWSSPTPAIEVGMVVLLKNEKLPPLTWPLGLVEEVYGSGSTIRTAKIKTAQLGVIVRATNHLVPLQVECC